MTFNTRVRYLYRDGSNYKQWSSVGFAGACDAAMRERLVAALDGGALFIARQIGLPELFFDDGVLYADDHCWHELSDVEATRNAVDDALARTIDEFVRDVECASSRGWAAFDRNAIS